MLLFKNTNILQLEDDRNAFLQTIIAIYILMIISLQVIP